MLLYHGSVVEVIEPDLSSCRDNTDFGKGFYTTTNKEQAEKWTRIKCDRVNVKEGHISVYSFDETILNSSNVNVYHFGGPTKEWLDFVVANRRGNPTKRYDIVEGPVANDRLYTTIILYEQGILSAEACVEQLQTHKFFDQLSFHSEKAIELLQFQEVICYNFE